MAKAKKPPREKAQPFRKVTVAMWSDAKFRALTPLPPSGQSLWIYLLTGRETCQIPGLTACGRGSLTDSLRWPPSAFAAAWGEIAVQGMAEADWTAPLIWIPNAIRHNFPESPSVVIGWRLKWNEIPDCPLKLKAWRVFAEVFQAKGEPWAQAFAQACRQPVGQAVNQAVPQTVAHQEQEQEQDTLTDDEGGGFAKDFPPLAVVDPLLRWPLLNQFRRAVSDALGGQQNGGGGLHMPKTDTVSDRMEASLRKTGVEGPAAVCIQNIRERPRRIVSVAVFDGDLERLANPPAERDVTAAPENRRNWV